MLNVRQTIGGFFAQSRAVVKQTIGQSQTVVKEIIGRVAYVRPFWQAQIQRNVDSTITDFIFWDNLRRCRARGYELAGLFCVPICQIIVSWVMGATGPTAHLDTQETGGNVEYTNDLLTRFLRAIQGLLMTVIEDLYALGDQYLFINPDATISVASPETVEVEYDPVDYRKPVAYTITTRSEKAMVTDRFTAQNRVITIQRYTQDSVGKTINEPVEVQTYRNLIGRIPVVHLKNDAAQNESNGRPIYESMYRLFSRYNDLLEKALDGAELSGNPIPVFQGMSNIDETIEANATAEAEEYLDVDGNVETRKLIKFDRLSAIFVGEGGSFTFASPAGGFTSDIMNMLKALFMLLMDHTRIPEYMWGGEVASGRASTQEQADPFMQYINARRIRLQGRGSDDLLQTEAQGGLLELLDIWLRTRKLTDPKVIVAPVLMDWPELSTEDEQVKMQWTQWAKGLSMLDDETALDLTGLVSDPAETLKKAKKEAETKQAEAAKKQQQAAAQQQAQNQPEPGNPLETMMKRLSQPEQQTGDQAAEAKAQKVAQIFGDGESVSELVLIPDTATDYESAITEALADPAIQQLIEEHGGLVEVSIEGEAVAA